MNSTPENDSREILTQALMFDPALANRDGLDEVEVLAVLGQDRLEVSMNNMAKLPFELSVPISRARLKPHRGTGIVEY